MASAILSNAFQVLGLPAAATARQIRRRRADLDKRREQGESVPSDQEVIDAVQRLRDPFRRVFEHIFSSTSDIPGCREASADLRQAVTQIADARQIREAHETWRLLAESPRLVHDLRAVVKATLPWKRATIAKAAIAELPGVILRAHAILCRRARDVGDLELARSHARAVSGSSLGDPRQRDAALAVAFAPELHSISGRLDHASSGLDAVLEIVQGLDEKVAAGKALLETAASEIVADSARISEVSPEAGGLAKDALARLHRRLALVSAQAGQLPARVAEDLREAAALATSEELRDEFHREAADPEWAAKTFQALEDCRKGLPERAWRRMRTLRRQADRPDRRARVEEIRRTPWPWVARARREPFRFVVFGCGLGFWGRRQFGPHGAVASSWGLLFLGIQVMTQGVFLRRPDSEGGPYQPPVTIGRIPLAFGPRQWKAVLSLIGILIAVAAAGGFGLEQWTNQKEHRSLSEIRRRIESGQLEGASELLADCDQPSSPIVQWRRDRALAAFVRAEFQQLRSAEDAEAFLKRIRHADGDERPLPPPTGPWPMFRSLRPSGIASWMNRAMDGMLVERLSAIPVTTLPPGGGPSWSQAAEPWDREAVWIADLVAWGARRSPGLAARRESFALENARRFDSPHLWALAVEFEQEKGGPVSPESLRKLGSFLESSRYGEWERHYRVYARSASAEDAERILDRRARGIWIGYDLNSDLKSIEDLIPEPLRTLTATGVPEGDRAALSPTRRELCELGARYRDVSARTMQAMEFFDAVEVSSLLAEYPPLIQSVPEDEWLPEVYCHLLNFMGRRNETIAFAEGRTFAGRSRVLSTAYIGAGRLEDALRVLEAEAAASLPRLRRLQGDWRAALGVAEVRWRAQLGGRPPDEPLQRRILRGDGGPVVRSPEEWVRAAAYWEPGMSRWRLRWLMEDSRIEALRLLCECHLARRIRLGRFGAPHADLAVLLLSELVSWLGSSTASESPSLTLECALALRSGEEPGAIADRFRREEADQKLAALAVICKAATRRTESAGIYLLAWECAPESRKRLYALAGLGLADTPADRLLWVRRAGGPVADLAERALKVPDLMAEGRWDELAEIANTGRRMLSGVGEDRDTRAGEAVWALLAWCAMGGRRELDEAASKAAECLHGGPLTEPGLLRVCLRVLLARADVDLSEGSLRPDLVHGSLDMDWIEFAADPPDGHELARKAAGNPDVAIAEVAAGQLLDLLPGDEEALNVLSLLALLKADPSTFPNPRAGRSEHSGPDSAAEMPARIRPSDSLPDPPIRPTPAMFKMIERSLEAPALDPNSPSRACLLCRRAVVRLLVDPSPDTATIDASIRDLQESVYIRESSRSMDILAALLVLRDCREIPDSDSWAPQSAAAAEHSTLFAFALRASLRPGDFQKFRAGDAVRRATAIADRRLNSRSKPLTLESLAVLRILGHPRLKEAESRLREEATALAVAKSRSKHIPSNLPAAFANWLAIDVLQGREAAVEFGEQSPVRAAFKALQEP
ncbi:MAG: hypothetical protein HYY18_12900 [Planctomycetes bacterium]|nr:hypothetical protein [Planctomycetota bacterium]